MVIRNRLFLLLGLLVLVKPDAAWGQTQPKQPFDVRSPSPQQAESPSKTEPPVSTPQVVPPGTMPVLTPSPSSDFEKIFGHPRSSEKVQRTIVPLFLNDELSEQTLVLLSPGSAAPVRVQAVPFLRQTLAVVRSDIQAKLQAQIDQEGALSLEAIRQAGLGAIFDDRRLELRIQIPPALRQTNLYTVGAEGLPSDAQNARLPAKVSGYLNLRGSESIVWSSRSASDLGRQPLSLDLEGAINVHGWVLEGSASYSEKQQPHAFRRNDLRLVKDDPANALRYVLGDLAIPVVGYQSSRPQFGFTVARNFGLQPYRVTRPISQFEFFLERPSRVDVLSNGVQVQTLLLPAGPQDIRNLSLNAGINNVQLVITDDVGRVQRLDFSRAIAGELLAPGLQQFAYSVGFPTRMEAGIRDYDWSLPTLTLSHRWGVNDVLTLGGYVQANFKHQLVGVEGTWATSIGNFSGDVAVSHAKEIGSDYAFRLRYDFLASSISHPFRPTFGITLEKRGANFTTLDDLDLFADTFTTHNQTSLDLTAYYNQQLFGGISSNLNVRYRFGRDVPDAYQISLRLSKSFPNGLGVSLALSDNHNQTGPDEQRATVNLFWFFPQARQSVQATTEVSNISEPSQRVTWNYSSPNPFNGINASLEAGLTPTEYGLSSRFTYNSYRAKVELFQDLQFPRDRAGDTFNATRLDFGTAVVFADGRWGLSRPVNGSFALVVPNQGLQGQQVGINPNGTGGYIAKTDWLGAAVVPDLQSYQASTLRLDVPQLPVGYDLGATNYTVLPTYKSGTLIQVGTDATVFLRGVVIDTSGAPLALQTGEIVSLADSTWKPVTVFTNKAGKFALVGFKPGRYEIHLYANPKAVIPFEIPAGKTGVFDVGTLRSPVPFQ